jgi:hypothetical protein
MGQCDVICQNYHIKESDIEYSKKGLDDIIKSVVRGEKLFENC